MYERETRAWPTTCTELTIVAWRKSTLDILTSSAPSTLAHAAQRPAEVHEEEEAELEVLLHAYP